MSDPQRDARQLRARLAAGDLDPARVALAAWSGHPGARLALGGSWPPPPTRCVLIAHAREHGVEVALRAALGVCREALAALPQVVWLTGPFLALDQAQRFVDRERAGSSPLLLAARWIDLRHPVRRGWIRRGTWEPVPRCAGFLALACVAAVHGEIELFERCLDRIERLAVLEDPGPLERGIARGVWAWALA